MVSLSQALLREQEVDFKKCIDYYNQLKLDNSNFSPETTALFRRAHGFAFTLGLWITKLEGNQNPAKIYLNQMLSDAIQVMPTVALGDKRGLRLYARAQIEDALKYVFYCDHPVEFELLQLEPKSHTTMDELFEWAKRHPIFKLERDSVELALGVLASAYAELSLTVHATTVKELELSTAVSSLHRPFKDAVSELAKLQGIFESVTFLLALFHREIMKNLDLNERALVSQFLSTPQKKILSGLK